MPQQTGALPAPSPDLEGLVLRFWHETKAAYQAAASGRIDDLELALDRRQSLLERAAAATQPASPAAARTVAEFGGRIQALGSDIDTHLRSRLKSARDALRQVRLALRLARAYSRGKRHKGGAVFQRDA